MFWNTGMWSQHVPSCKCPRDAGWTRRWFVYYPTELCEQKAQFFSAPRISTDTKEMFLLPLPNQTWQNKSSLCWILGYMPGERLFVLGRLFVTDHLLTLAITLWKCSLNKYLTKQTNKQTHHKKAIHLTKYMVIFPLKVVFNVWGGRTVCTSIYK